MIKAGSVTVKINTGRIGRYRTFTVYWRVAGRSHRKTFSHEKEAVKFAREQAENLAAGQVQSPSISSMEVATFREAERRLGDTAPVHVAAGEYASAFAGSVRARRSTRPSSSSCTTRSVPSFNGPFLRWSKNSS